MVAFAPGADSSVIARKLVDAYFSLDLVLVVALKVASRRTPLLGPPGLSSLEGP